MDKSQFAAFLSGIESEYELEKPLKSSPRGSVELLRRRSDGRRFIFRRYTGEASVYRALQQTDNPHLPAIHRVEEADGECAVLTEYITGDTLAYLLEGSLLSEAEAADILRQLCLALKDLHALGAVHRDIKPENVILAGSTAVLIDFDAARIVKPDSSADTQVLGTTGFAAPEQYGFSQTDARSDIYSLGVLLNVMLTGKHPSVTLTESPLRSVVETCTAISADRRFQSVDELQTALKKAPRRRRHILPAAIGCAAVLALGLILFSQLRPVPSVMPVSISEPEDGADRTDASSAEPSEEIYTVSLEPAEGSLPVDTVTSSEMVPDAYTTTFTYDLDGDGEAEHYLFALATTFNNGVTPLGTDSFANDAGETQSRSVAPGVWRLDDNGSRTEAHEFAALLTDAQISVYGARITGTELPFVSEEEPIFGVWAPAITATFNENTIGTWVFYASATIDGELLTARGVSRQLTVEQFKLLVG